MGSYDIYLQNLAPEDWLGPEDTIHFARTGVQQRTMAKLKKGQLSLEARLDLHKLTADEAIAQCTRFFTECLAQGIRTVLLITGKSQVSSQAKGPVLKNILHRWMREQPFVLAYSTCKPKHGGSGAYSVLLRNRNKFDEE